MVRTTLLVRDLPNDRGPLVLGIPFGYRTWLRVAQTWEAGKIERYPLHPPDGPIRFARALATFADVPLLADDPAACREAWDTFCGTLCNFLRTWVMAGQESFKWWADSRNSALAAAVRATDNQFKTVTRPTFVDGRLVIARQDVLVSMPESLIDLAESVACRIFNDVLTRNEQLSLCAFCVGVYTPEERGGSPFHARVCQQRYCSYRTSRAKKLRRKYRQILVASRALDLWRLHPKNRNSRSAVQEALRDRHLIEDYHRSSRTYGRFRTAALAGRGSDKRANLLSDIVDPVRDYTPSDVFPKLVRRISERLDQLYAKIEDASHIESSHSRKPRRMR
jgi:hypothetical protein